MNRKKQNHFKRGALLCFGFILLNVGGCKSVEPNDSPALLIIPSNSSTPSSRDQNLIASVIAEKLNLANVRLGKDAFAKSSLLTLERPPVQGIGANNPNSMLIGKPEQFRLLKTSTGCMLLRLKTDEQYPLDVRCRAE